MSLTATGGAGFSSEATTNTSRGLRNFPSIEGNQNIMGNNGGGIRPPLYVP